MISYEILSETGSRSVNEDSVGKTRKGDIFCFVVADGLGGHGKGEVASAEAVRAVLDYFEESGSLDETCVKECFMQAQQSVMQKQQETGRPMEMKTTMVLLLTDGKKAIWGHVGDSRLYRFYKSKEMIHTLDHSVPQMLAALGEIKEKDIRGHADRNRLLRVLGVNWDKPMCEVSLKLDVGEKDAFLLCTDGFWEYIEEKDMLQTLKKAKSTGQWMTKMKTIILKNGEGANMDNYSAIAIRMIGDR